MSGKVTITKILNPFDVKNRDIRRVGLDDTATLSSFVNQCMTDEFVVSLNGTIVDPTNWDTTKVVGGDSIVMCPVVAGGKSDGKNIMRIVAALAILIVSHGVSTKVSAAMVAANFSEDAAGAVGYIAAASVAMAGAMLVNAVMPPAIPDMPDDSGTSYGWGPLRNFTDQGRPIPVLYGVHRVAGTIIQQYVSTSDNKQWLNVLLAICGHEIDSITDIWLNDQDVSGFHDVTTYTRLGTNDDQIIPGFDKVVSQTDYSVRLGYDTTIEHVVTDEQLSQSVGPDADSREFSGYLAHSDIKQNSITVTTTTTSSGSITGTDDGNGNITGTGIVSGTIDYIRGYYRIFFDSTVTSPALMDYTYKTYTGTPVVRQTSDETASEIEVEVGFPMGLCKFEEKYDWVTVSHEVKVRKVTDTTDWDLVPTAATITTSSNEPSPVYDTVRITGLDDTVNYDVYIRRTSEDRDDPAYTDDSYLTAIREYTDEAIQYNGVAKYAVLALATEQLSGSIPTITCLASRLNVWVYDGSSWVQKSAQNPAWAAYDVLVRAVELTPGTITVEGVSPTNIDLATFQEWSDYCDADTSERSPDDPDYAGPKFTLNYYKESASTVWDVLVEICKVGHAVPIMRGTNYSVIVDKPALPVQTFSLGNISKGTFEINYLPMKDRATCCEVSYFDAEEKYNRKTLLVYSDEWDTIDTPDKRAQITIIGCTDKDQAVREGAYQLNSTGRLIRSIAFGADIDAIACTSGDVITVQHDVPNYDTDTPGRVVAATSTTITLDREVTLDPGVDYSVLVQTSDDTIQERVVSPVASQTTTSVLTVTSAFSPIPEQYNVVLFGETEDYAKDYRIVEVARKGDMSMKITAIEYDEAIYDLTAGVLPPPSPHELPEVTAVWAKVYPSRTGHRSLQPNILITWSISRSDYASGWDVYLEKVGTNTPRFIGTTRDLNLRVGPELFDYGEDYTVYVMLKGQGAFDLTTNTYTFTAIAPFFDPLTPDSFTGTYNPVTHSVDFHWVQNANQTRDSFYEIREGGTDWDTATTVLKGLRGDETSLFIDGDFTGTKTYRIKSYYLGGVYTGSDLSCLVDIDTGDCLLSGPPTGLAVTSRVDYNDETGQWEGELSATWDDMSGEDYFAYYIVRLKNTLTGNVWFDTSQTNSYATPVNINRSYTVRVASMDINNNATSLSDGVSKLVSLPTTPPNPVDAFTAMSLPRAILLNWTYTDDRKDLAYFEIARRTDSTSPGDSDVIERITQLHYRDDDVSADTDYYYWVRVVTVLRLKSTWLAVTPSPIQRGQGGEWPDTTTLPVPTGLYVTSHIETLDDGTRVAMLDCAWDAITGHWELAAYQLRARHALTGKYTYQMIPHTQNIGSILVEWHRGYYVSIRAIDKYGNTTDWSSEVYQTATGDSTPPSAITSLNAQSYKNGIWIDWGDPNYGEGVFYYKVYRNDVDNVATAQFIKRVSRHKTGTWDHPTGWGTFYYWVYVVDRAGNISSASNVASASKGRFEFLDLTGDADDIDSGSNNKFMAAQTPVTATTTADSYSPKEGTTFFEVENDSTWPSDYGQVLTFWSASDRAVQYFYKADWTSTGSVYTRHVSASTWPNWTDWRTRFLLESHTLDNVSDGTNFKRIAAAWVLSGNKAKIDFSDSHDNKVLDYIASGTKATRLYGKIDYSNLRANYAFSEGRGTTVHDHCNQFHATIQGTPPDPNWFDAPDGYCIKAGPSAGYAQATVDSGSNADTSAITIWGWFKYTSSPSSYNAHDVFKWDWDAWVVRIYNDGSHDKLQIYLKDRSAGASSYATFTPNLSTNRWYYFSIKWEGNSVDQASLQLYDATNGWQDDTQSTDSGINFLRLNSYTYTPVMGNPSSGYLYVSGLCWAEVAASADEMRQPAFQPPKLTRPIVDALSQLPEWIGISKAEANANDTDISLTSTTTWTELNSVTISNNGGVTILSVTITFQLLSASGGYYLKIQRTDSSSAIWSYEVSGDPLKSKTFAITVHDTSPGVVSKTYKLYGKCYNSANIPIVSYSYISAVNNRR